MKPILAISIGDYNGIGPEVVLKALASGDDLPFTPLILGHPSILEFYGKLSAGNSNYYLAESVSRAKSGRVNVMAVDDLSGEEIKPGEITAKAGGLSMKAVEKGIELCQTGKAAALVTAPISKEAIHMAGYRVPGHTEFLAQKTQCKDYVMMLVSKTLRVGLASTHIPLQEVAKAVTKENIIKKLTIINHSLQTDYGIRQPQIAVLGLNPHAGDGGVIGNEETDIIFPAIKEAARLSIIAKGPFPADGFFGARSYEKYDAVLAMYHDQGLVPFKTISFNAGVNFTAGLPIIRTSPDHGTAFAIAGQGKADSQSFQEALGLAFQLHQNKLITLTTPR
ncbi:MAG: 4-hydroxythreonine-4-phosphate dehydrogenase PdxA [Balneolales bacterium]